MTTPPQKLIDRLQALPFMEAVMEVRNADGTSDEVVTVAHAIGMAMQGLIEGVGPPSGRISYLRRLLKSAQPEMMEASELEQDTGRSTAFASTNMGVFREPVREVFVAQDCFGGRVATGSGDVVGHVWTHCAMRPAAA